MNTWNVQCTRKKATPEKGVPLLHCCIDGKTSPMDNHNLSILLEKKGGSGIGFA
jgi:hypothetical protein